MKNCFRLSALFFIFALLASTAWAAYRPVPDNRNLSEIFNSIKVDSRDLTRVRFIANNDDALYCRWKMIEEAKETIDCTY
ncbi:MAG: hypothetical protein AB1403_14755, partial [Candidatus Riflebacteria bacterium]